MGNLKATNRASIRPSFSCAFFTKSLRSHNHHEGLVGISRLQTKTNFLSHNNREGWFSHIPQAHLALFMAKPGSKIGTQILIQNRACGSQSRVPIWVPILGLKVARGNGGILGGISKPLEQAGCCSAPTRVEMCSGNLPACPKKSNLARAKIQIKLIFALNSV